MDDACSTPANFPERPIQSTNLSHDAFAVALRHGRGATVMHVQEHGLDGVEDLVLAACLENQCYDRQCEGSRAAWVFGFYKGTPAYGRFAEAILTAMSQGIDDYDGDQQRELASLMGRDGDLEAAAALRAQVWGQTFSADVRNAAAVALSHTNDPRVRKLALERLNDPGFSSDYSEELDLFKNNYQAGDETLILAALERQTVDGWEAHNLGSCAIEVCSSANSPALSGVAEWVYRTNPCSICRQRAVEKLQEWNRLPPHIAAECRHDALEDLRKLMQGPS
ncbi:hypothetical protein RBA41_07815 [Massilia sp. CCM 9210]|uniref:hypothetical protein n=1 Tax=Massilia scottii TaxID=3057166 RepID=UPI002796ABCB|nr:hypothetical protein [Massilia sp. CCM 9210]MDQ1813206.1 hypothetical protein [Massilia sp. CCM 9210]